MNIGSYIGVPVFFSDGQVVGTLCGIDPAPRSFTADQLNFLQVLARFMAALLEKNVGVLPGKLGSNIKQLQLAQSQLKSSTPIAASPLLKGSTANMPSLPKPVALVFDSTSENRQGLASTLRSAGYTVSENKKPLEIAMIEKEFQVWQPTLAVVVATDPPEESLALIQALRRNDNYKAVSLVFMAHRRITSIRAKLAGADSCLLYNSTPEEFLAELQTMGKIPV